VTIVLATIAVLGWTAYVGACRRLRRKQRAYDALFTASVAIARERNALQRRLAWYEADAVQAAEDAALGRQP